MSSVWFSGFVGGVPIWFGSGVVCVGFFMCFMVMSFGFLVVVVSGVFCFACFWVCLVFWLDGLLRFGFGCVVWLFRELCCYDVILRDLDLVDVGSALWVCFPGLVWRGFTGCGVWVGGVWVFRTFGLRVWWLCCLGCWVVCGGFAVWVVDLGG